MNAPSGENGAKMIGQTQRDEKRVRHRAGAKDRRKHDVAKKAGERENERQSADSQNAAQHISDYDQVSARRRRFREPTKITATILSRNQRPDAANRH